MTDMERLRLLTPPFDAELHQLQQNIGDRQVFVVIAIMVMALLCLWA